jgi:hypothetical protein
MGTSEQVPEENQSEKGHGFAEQEANHWQAPMNSTANVVLSIAQTPS